MSKYDLMKNVAKKNSSKSTADSSKVSKPSQTQTRYTDTGTGGQTKKITSNPQKSTATYWQATQQSATQQATKQKTVQRKTLTGSMKRQAQVAEKEKRNKYAEATRNALKFDPNAQQDYSQFNAGIKALFSGRNVAGEMANYTNRNRKQIAQDIAGRQRQAGYAQSAVDKANADIASNDLTKTFSDLGMKGLGGMTSSVGGLIRGGSNLVQGFAGLTGNQDLARQALQFDRNLGTDEAIANINRNNTQANTFAGQVAESIGGMIPTIGANLVGGFAGVGEQAGLGLMGASVFGNAGSEAFNNLSEDGNLSRADALRALGYGGASAALEVGTEKLSDFIPGLDTFAFTNPDHLLGQAGGEALEEMVSSALEPFINPLADQNVQNAQQYGEQIDANTWTREHWQDILESGLLGAGTSLAMGAPANVRNAVENRYIDSLAEYNRQNNAGIPETNDYTVSRQTADVPFDQFYSESLDTAPSPGEELEPTEATLTKRQQKAVADEYKTDEIKPVDTQEVVTPEPEYVIPEDYQPDLSDEDTISDGEYRATDETFFDDDIEYVPTGDTDVDAVGRLKAVGEADPSNTSRIVGAYNDGIADVIADLDSIPGDVKSDMYDDMFINGEDVTQGAEKLSETRGSGVSQEFITDESAQEYGSRVNQRSDDVTYKTTSLDKVTASAKAKFDQMGENSMYDDWMSREPKTNLLTRFKNGIGTDYDTAVFVAEGQYLANQIELRKSDIIKKASDINAQVESFTDSRGNTSYRLVDQNGKALTGEQAEATVKDLTEATSRLDAIYRRLNNISHNAGLLLRQFWFKRMSPGAQVKALQDNVNKINDELNKKFRRKVESGEISPVTLNENSVQDYLKAETPEQKAQMLDQIAEEVAAQVPHTLAEKIDAFRYNNMLFNPLTFVRNTVGNAGQAQIAKSKDLVKYYIESLLKVSGAVRYNNLDMSQAVDHDLYNHAEQTAGRTISSDFAEAKRSGNVKKYLKSQGYTGDALRDISRFKGQTYNLGMTNGVLKSRMDEILANTAKEAGYTVNNGTLVDRNGTAITDKAYMKLVNDSYNQAKKQWISSDSLRASKADGAGRAKSTRAQRDIWKKEGYDLLNPNHTSVAGILDNSTSTDDAWRRAFNEYRRKNVFSNNNIFGREQNMKSHIIDYLMNENWYTGDDGFLRRGYARAMSQMLDAQGYTAEINDGQIQLKDRQGNLVDQSKADDILNRLNADAKQEALENTYHDTNKLADFLNQVRRDIPGTKIILDALMPFTRTPMNITRRAIEYSPIGLLKSIGQINKVKTGQMSAETWLNNISKGTTGAGAMAIGWLLASMGLLRGTGDEKDENVTRYEKDHGVQDYSVQLGDWSATLDWAAPGIAPFLLGAVMQEVTDQYQPREGDNALNTAWGLGGNYVENIGALLQPIADTTMLSGLMETLSAFGEEKDTAKEVISTATESYIRQFTPTLGSKIHGIFDPTKYSTYSDNFFERQLRASAINMRLLDYAISKATGEKFLQPQLDADGQPAQTQDYGFGMAGRAINNLLNPATVKKNTMTDTDDELLRLYKSTGNYGILARQQYYINNTNFTPEERSEFNQYYLPEYRKAAEEFINSPSYKNMDDDERVSVLNAMSKHLKSEANVKYLGKVVPNASESLTVRDKACDFAVSKGVTTAKYYQYMNTPFVKDKDGNTISNTRAMQIRAQMEADGIWDDIVKAIKDGKFEAKDFNLTKPVVKWDTSQFTYNYDLMQNGSYTGKY